MKKYLVLWWSFFRASLTADLEFRVNFLTRMVTDVFWYLAQIVSFEVFYLYTDNIGGWGRAEMRVFLGVLFLVDSIYMVLFSSNLDFLSDLVRKGYLDLLLTKPVNSQFIISLQRSATANLGNFLMAICWLAWSLESLEGFQWIRLLWLLIAVPSGVVIFYSLRFTFASTAVIFTRAENIQYLWYHLYKLGTRPDNIYPFWLKFVVLTAIPVGLIASVPARSVLQTADARVLLWSVFVAIGSLFASRWMWKRTLKHYASASS